MSYVSSGGGSDTTHVTSGQRRPAPPPGGPAGWGDTPGLETLARGFLARSCPLCSNGLHDVRNTRRACGAHRKPYGRCGAAMSRSYENAEVASARHRQTSRSMAPGTAPHTATDRCCVRRADSDRGWRGCGRTATRAVSEHDARGTRVGALARYRNVSRGNSANDVVRDHRRTAGSTVAPGIAVRTMVTGRRIASGGSRWRGGLMFRPRLGHDVVLRVGQRRRLSPGPVAVGHGCRGRMVQTGCVRSGLIDGDERTRPDCKLQ